jgi:DnaA family protein
MPVNLISKQLILPIRPHDDATFANFFPGKNQTVLSFLKSFIEKSSEPYVYLWGHPSVGCSHLLQACCQVMHTQALTAAYLPLAQIAELTPRIFENLESFALVCIDDVQNIAGKSAWEEALFHLYNRIMARPARLLLAAKVPPINLNLGLLDLASRLSNGVVFQIQALTDNEKLAALQLRAQLRGLELSDDVGQFLLRHYPRDFSHLFTALEQLDYASLTEQRRLTIPFVKQVLEMG